MSEPGVTGRVFDAKIDALGRRVAKLEECETAAHTERNQIMVKLEVLHTKVTLYAAAVSAAVALCVKHFL